MQTLTKANSVTVTVTLKNTQTANNYEVKGTYKTTATIAKAKIEEAKKAAEVTVQKGTKGLVDLKDKIAEGAAIENITIQEGKAGWFAGDADAPKVVNGNLSFKLTNDVTTDTGSNTARLTSGRRSTNYENLQIL